MKSALKNISWRAIRVWQRNWTVYLTTWKINFLPPLLEPLLFMFAFGFGLGQFVKTVSYYDISISYLDFIAPGLIATVIMDNAFFETTYASFVRMYYQKTYDAILSTPLLIEDIVAGELLWGATKSVIASIIMMAISSVLGLLEYPLSLWIIPLAIVSGIAFSSLGMIFTAVVKSIEQFNLPVFLFITPMFLFSGIFFPINALPVWAQRIAYFLPLTHLVIPLRQLTTAHIDRMLFYSAGILISLALISSVVSIILMKKRLIK